MSEISEEIHRGSRHKSREFASKNHPLKLKNRPVEFGDLPTYKNVLLLQGPLGPFFLKLSRFLESRGSTVYKVNFNSGDDYFYPANKKQVIQYKHRLEFWPEYVQRLIIDKKIDAVFLFGDCRPIHEVIKPLCQTYEIDLWALEEGYYRPHFFTMEYFGVNHFSPISRETIEEIQGRNASFVESPKFNSSYANSYWYMVRHGIQYWIINLFLKHNYSNYSHHRKLNLSRGIDWTRSFFRYWIYQITERKTKRLILNKEILSNRKNGKYFLLPLQVFDDAQLNRHSDFLSVEDLLELVMQSFATHLKVSNSPDVLIIKHHPMDRGHINYQKIILRLSELLGITSHLTYIHDIRLPDLYQVVSGCITVNSTLGLQALSHGVPTINLGRSFYSKRGLTFQGQLDSFWTSEQQVDKTLVETFKSHTIRCSQVNGSLYSPNYAIK